MRVTSILLAVSIPSLVAGCTVTERDFTDTADGSANHGSDGGPWSTDAAGRDDGAASDGSSARDGSGNSATDGSGNSATDGSGNSATDGSGNSATDGSGNSATDGSGNSATDGSGNSATDGAENGGESGGNGQNANGVQDGGDADGASRHEPDAADASGETDALGIVSCSRPSSPDGGSVSAPTLTVGSTAMYSCSSGYSLSGSTERVCQANATWSGDAPTCVPVNCGPPPKPVAGDASAPTTTLGAKATYSCNNGYYLSGAPERVCLATGVWSDTTPTCTFVDCGRPDDPVLGTVSAPSTTYGATATYSCRSGYGVFRGDANRTCTRDGTWSGTAPVCRQRSCLGSGPGAGFNCGASGTEDCCGSPLVTGGTFNRDNLASYPATVSDFALDAYEITVGRFRAFVEAGAGTLANPPAAGAGANPHVAGSGWDSAWNVFLAADTPSLRSAMQCLSTYQTWTAGDDRLPIMCITWYEAFAFCIWDGGRLPTELEWNYAAAGGKEQRTYPWGQTVPGSDTKLAVYGGYYSGSTGVSDIAPVGLVTAGNGRWGQSDLGGSVWEWNFDWSADYPSSCNNCAGVTPATNRVRRGGSFEYYAYGMTSSFRFAGGPTSRYYDVGARCARTP